MEMETMTCNGAQNHGGVKLANELQYMVLCP